MHILLHRRRASESQSVQGQFDMVQAGERRSQHAHTMCHSSPSRDSTHDLLGQDDDCLGEVLMAAFTKRIHFTPSPLDCLACCWNHVNTHRWCCGCSPLGGPGKCPKRARGRRRTESTKINREKSLLSVAPDSHPK
jgi:hypothetical protein